MWARAAGLVRAFTVLTWALIPKLQTALRTPFVRGAPGPGGWNTHVGRWFQEGEQHRQQSGGLDFCSERPRTRGRGGGRTFGPKRGAPWGTRSPCGLQNRVLHASGLLCAPREPTVQVAPGAEGRLGSVCTTLTGPPARSGAAPRLPRHPCRSLLGEHSMAWKGGADRLITSPVGRPGGQGLWFPRGRHFPAT